MFAHAIGLAFEPANAGEERALGEMASNHSVALTPIPPYEQTNDMSGGDGAG